MFGNLNRKSKFSNLSEVRVGNSVKVKLGKWIGFA